VSAANRGATILARGAKFVNAAGAAVMWHEAGSPEATLELRDAIRMTGHDLLTGGARRTLIRNLIPTEGVFSY